MTRFSSPLERVNIASPCSARWEDMIGNEKKRYCGECRLNVYNLSGLTHVQAEELIVSEEGRLCVRLFRRADGSIITKDCPIGWQRLKRKMSRFWTAAVSLLFAFFGGSTLAVHFHGTMTGNKNMISADLSGEVRESRETAEPLMGNVALTETELKRYY